MEKANRLQLLRSRLKALGGYVSIPRHEPKRPYVPRLHHSSQCVRTDQFVREMPHDWLSKADSRPLRTLRATRTVRKTALTRIAERWDERKSIAAPRNRSRF